MGIFNGLKGLFKKDHTWSELIDKINSDFAEYDKRERKDRAVNAYEDYFPGIFLLYVDANGNVQEHEVRAENEIRPKKTEMNVVNCGKLQDLKLIKTTQEFTVNEPLSIQVQTITYDNHCDEMGKKKVFEKVFGIRYDDKTYIFKPLNASNDLQDGGQSHRKYELRTVKELQEICAKRKIKYKGLKKAELIKALRKK